MPTTQLSLFTRIGYLMSIIILLMLPSFWISSLVEDRQEHRDVAISSIASEWGKQQTIVGPYLLIQYRTMKKGTWYNEQVELLPKQLTATSNVQVDERQRGIYAVPTYEATVNLTADFTDALSKKLASLTPLQRPKVKMCFGVSDGRGMSDVAKAQFNGRTYQVHKFNGAKKLAPYVFCTDIPSSELLSANNVHVDVTLRGTEQLRIATIGSETRVVMHSNWADPQFVGTALPNKRTVSETGFTGEWHRNSFASDSQVLSFSKEAIAERGNVGATLFQTVTSTTLIDRITKYALLVVALTFLSLFLFEIMYNLKIHPVQYGLIGISLIVFYVLLLGLSEHINFGIAYLLSSTATIALNLLYVKWSTKARKCVYTTLAVLTSIYTYMFIIIRLEDYAMLAGSIGVFTTVGVVMYATRKVNWFAIQRPTELKKV